MGWPERLALVRRSDAEGAMALLRRMGPADRAVIWGMLTSAERCALVLAAGAVPEGISEAIPVAPARGALEPFVELEIVRSTDGSERVQRANYLDRGAGRVADAFTRMERRRPARERREVGPLFTPGQVAMGRAYAALAERCAASGVKGVSLEVMASRSGGGSGGFMDAVIADHERLRAMERRIGDGVALAVRRVRPGVRGARSGIRCRRLVDMVCLGGASLSEVLAAHGWAVKGETREAARLALAAALDRMQGYA
jgi:hypothetical protein